MRVGAAVSLQVRACKVVVGRASVLAAAWRRLAKIPNACSIRLAVELLGNVANVLAAEAAGVCIRVPDAAVGIRRAADLRLLVDAIPLAAVRVERRDVPCALLAHRGALRLGGERGAGHSAAASERRVPCALCERRACCLSASLHAGRWRAHVVVPRARVVALAVALDRESDAVALPRRLGLDGLRPPKIRDLTHLCQSSLDGDARVVVAEAIGRVGAQDIQRVRGAKNAFRVRCAVLRVADNKHKVSRRLEVG